MHRSTPDASRTRAATAVTLDGIRALGKHYVGLSVGTVVARVRSGVVENAVARRHCARLVGEVHPAVAAIVLVAKLAAVNRVGCHVHLEGPVGHGRANPVDSRGEVLNVALRNLSEVLLLVNLQFLSFSTTLTTLDAEAGILVVAVVVEEASLVPDDATVDEVGFGASP